MIILGDPWGFLYILAGFSSIIIGAICNSKLKRLVVPKIEKNIGGKIPSGLLGVFYYKMGAASVVIGYFLAKFLLNKFGMKGCYNKAKRNNYLLQIDYPIENFSKEDIKIIVTHLISSFIFFILGALIFLKIIVFAPVHSKPTMDKLPKYYQFTPPPIKSPALEQYGIQLPERDTTNRY